jgi:hypothetical protein
MGYVLYWFISSKEMYEMIEQGKQEILTFICLKNKLRHLQRGLGYIKTPY